MIIVCQKIILQRNIENILITAELPDGLLPILEK